MEGFSIIIPLYNKENTIVATLESISKINYLEYEILVIDDGSTDSSGLKVKEFQNNKIHYYYKDNAGVSSARNYGVRYATYKWIIFLDADDVLYENSLSVFDSLIRKYEFADVIVANFDSNRLGKKLRSLLNEHVVSYPAFCVWLGLLYPRPGVFCCTKDIYWKVGGFDERISYYEDGYFGINLVSQSRCVYTPIPIMKYVENNAEASLHLHRLEKELSYYMEEIPMNNIWEKDWYFRVLEQSIKRRQNAGDETSLNVLYSIKRRVFKFGFLLLHFLLVIIRKLFIHYIKNDQ